MLSGLVLSDMLSPVRPFICLSVCLSVRQTGVSIEKRLKLGL